MPIPKPAISKSNSEKNHLALNETGLHAAEHARRVLEADKDFEARVRAFDRSLHTLSIGFCAPVPQAVLTPLINSIFYRKALFFTAENADMKIFSSH